MASFKSDIKGKCTIIPRCCGGGYRNRTGLLGFAIDMYLIILIFILFKIKTENLSFLKVLSANGIIFDTLMTSGSFENVIENIDTKLSDYPFYIKNDGILFL